VLIALGFLRSPVQSIIGATQNRKLLISLMNRSFQPLNTPGYTPDFTSLLAFSRLFCHDLRSSRKFGWQVVPRLSRPFLPSLVVGFFHGAFQPHLDQMQHAPINNSARYRL
jgi:hypothetical protein